MCMNQCQGSSSKVDWVPVDYLSMSVCFVTGKDAGRETVMARGRIDG